MPAKKPIQMSAEWMAQFERALTREVIYPVLVGGAQYARELSARFESYTVADSHPFMLAMHRQELRGEGRWVRKRFSRSSLDTLLLRNVARWAEALGARAAMPARRALRLRLAS